MSYTTVKVQDVKVGQLVMTQTTGAYSPVTDGPIITGQGVYLNLADGTQIMCKLDQPVPVRVEHVWNCPTVRPAPGLERVRCNCERTL